MKSLTNRFLRRVTLFAVSASLVALVLALLIRVETSEMRRKYDSIRLGSPLGNCEASIAMPMTILAVDDDTDVVVLHEEVGPDPPLLFMRHYSSDGTYGIVLYYDPNSEKVAGKKLLVLHRAGALSKLRAKGRQICTSLGI